MPENPTEQPPSQNNPENSIQPQGSAESLGAVTRVMNGIDNAREHLKAAVEQAAKISDTTPEIQQNLLRLSEFFYLLDTALTRASSNFQRSVELTVQARDLAERANGTLHAVKPTEDNPAIVNQHAYHQEFSGTLNEAVLAMVSVNRTAEIGETHVADLEHNHTLAAASLGYAADNALRALGHMATGISANEAYRRVL